MEAPIDVTASVARVGARAVRRSARDVGRRVRIEVDWLASRRRRADLALFHEFAPPPTGGGHQFLRALIGELQRRGLQVELAPADLVRVLDATPAEIC